MEYYSAVKSKDIMNFAGMTQGRHSGRQNILPDDAKN